jgi:uncharacterized protein YoxC
MEDANYRYLDEERIKLWRELRHTQAQLNSFMEVVEGDQNAVENGLRRLGLKAARAYNKLTEREAMSETLIAKLDTSATQGNEILGRATAVDASLKTTDATIKEAERTIGEALSKCNEELKSIGSKTNELEERLESVNQYVETAENQRDELEEKLDDFSAKYEDVNKQHSEISKLHSLLFGYEKSDGEIVEGKKQELETVYDDLRQKIGSTRAEAETFESDYKQKVSEFLSSARAEAEALSQKVRGLLPDAMTAGLSAAYLANRQMEEKEQSNQLTTFKRCIKGMMALALLPIAINLYLWLCWNKSFTDILSMLPREVMYILPIYIPLFWLAIFANKRVNLSKRLIEEYKHKEAVSKTYEGLSKQIDELGDDAASRELRTRLLYNTVMLSEKNPGELIKNFNRPDNPLLDVLNQGTKFSEAIANLKQFPGFEGIVDIAKAMSQNSTEAPKTKSDNDVDE